VTMGRLFWKFFFSFWLTLLVAAISAGSFVWLERAANDDDLGDLKLLDYRAIAYVKVAADIGQKHGEKALKDFLKQIKQDQLSEVLAVNADQQDILGRPVDIATHTQAQQLFAKGKRKLVEQVNLANSPHLLYAPLKEPEPLSGHHKRRWLLEHLPFLLITLSGLFASLLFSALLAWYFTRPIRNLKQAFNEVAEGKLETRVSPAMGKRQDELADLGKSFDFMTTKIGVLINGQKQLLHDVSHELRSPLARMQAAIGIAQQQPAKVDATLERLEREAERISDLIGELLLISRIETGINEGKQSKVNITDLLDEIVEDARFEAEANAITINYENHADIELLGQQALLHRAIENVVRNAVKYSHEGDKVSIKAEIDASQKALLITVIDQGPGVAEEELDKLFTPFFRGQQPQRKDGVGLGLTIAQQAVIAHHGQIRARNKAECGLEIQISIPLNQV